MSNSLQSFTKIKIIKMLVQALGKSSQLALQIFTTGNGQDKTRLPPMPAIILIVGYASNNTNGSSNSKWNSEH